MKKHNQKLTYFVKSIILCSMITFFVGCTKEDVNSVEENTEIYTEEVEAKAQNPLRNFKTKNGWADSFSVNGKCYCRSTYDHGIGNKKFKGKTVRSICEKMKKDMQKAWKKSGKVLYNTVQCGHNPAHGDNTIYYRGKKHKDEILCPGRVKNGLKCNSQKGPKWDNKYLK